MLCLLVGENYAARRNACDRSDHSVIVHSVSQKKSRRKSLRQVAPREEITPAKILDQRHVASTLPVSVPDAAPGINAELPGIIVELVLAALRLHLELNLLFRLFDEPLDRRVSAEHRE